MKKILYGLKQAPRSWYERLGSFLTEQSFTRGQVDKTLFIKKVNNELLIVQIYVDDIIFGATNEILCKEFDAILPRKGPVTRAMSKRLQEDWARAAEEGPRVLMNLRVDF